MGYKDKEKAKEYRKRYHAVNKEKENEYRKRYYANNKEKISKQHTQYMRNYYQNNKDRIQKYHRQYMRDYNKNSKAVVYACNKRLASAKRAIWTAEEEATLFELRKEGLTCTEIAIALGRSRESVQSKIGRIHRKQRMESINELQDLIELYHINSSLGGD